MKELLAGILLAASAMAEKYPDASVNSRPIPTKSKDRTKSKNARKARKQQRKK
jgi:hypothetical protein